MSDKKDAAEGKKKGGKLPIIVALVLVLGGGGFFMMRGNSKPAEKPKPKLGEMLALEEFLVNIRPAGSYARVTIELGLDDKTGAKDLEKKKPVLRDTILQVIQGRAATEFTADGGRLLKEEIAAALNHRLEPLLHKGDAKPKEEEEEEEEESTEDGEKKDGEKKSADSDKKGHGKPERFVRKKRKLKEFDSDEGPVLLVLITNFTTQSY